MAEVLHLALGRGDIAGRSVVDLGCGNGVFAIGAKLAGAARVVGVDSDPKAMEVSRRNARRNEVEIEWVLSDVGRYRDSFDTVLMNPPFGAQTHHADRPFLHASMAVGHVLYTFLNVNSEDFVRRRFENAGARITDRLEYRFPIAYMFPFHRDGVRAQPVLLYRIEVAKG